MKRVSIILAAAALTGWNAAYAARSATGVVGFADSWMGADQKWGFYEIPTEGVPESLPLILPSDYTRCGLGGLYFEGRFMGIFDSSDFSGESVSYYVTDVASGVVKGMGDLPTNFMAYSMVYDPETRLAYGSFAETDSGKTWFGTFDPVTTEMNRLREFKSATAWFGMGLTPEGDLYAIDKNGMLYKVDKKTGNYSVVKMTQLSTTYLTSGAVNPEDGYFYYATSHDAGSAFYCIDLADGSSSKVYDLPDNEEIRSLFFPTDVDFLAAPVAPSAAAVDFPGGALKGIFSFTMPSLLSDGAAAPTSMAYTLEVDGEPYAQGTAAPGEEVKVDVEVKESGMHSFTVRAFNGERAGEALVKEFFIGPVEAMTPPYLQTFTTQEEADQMLVINANGDAHAWEWDKRGYMGYYYSFTEAADDYLVTPAMQLEAGKSYSFSFEAYRWEGRYPAETVAAYVGVAPSAEALSECIIAPTQIDNTVPETLSGNFTPAADGIYYFAVKAMSPANCFALYIDNVAVSAPMVGLSPAAPVELTAVPDINGALRANVTFTAPSLTMDGEPLEAISKAEIFRGNDVIATLTPKPGEKVEYTDTEAAAGNNTYAVVCYGSDGSVGERAAVTVFVGHTKPVAPENIEVREGVIPSQVVVSWDAVTKDINGLNIAPGEVTYTVTSVINGHQEVMTEGKGDTELTCTISSMYEDQEFLQFVVYATNNAGISDRGVSQPYAYGTPYELPFEESFADGAVQHAITTVSDGAVWWSATDADYEGNITAQDDDNGYVVMSSSALGDSAWLYTGKLNLTEAKTPMLSFWFFSLRSDDTNTLQVFAADANSNLYSPVSPLMVLGGRESRGWYPVEVSLDDFAGREIQLGLQGYILKYGILAVDNLRVYDAGSGVDDVVASPAASSVVVVSGGIISCEEVTVYDTAGRQVARGSGYVSLSSGLYIVRTHEGDSLKISVR